MPINSNLDVVIQQDDLVVLGPPETIDVSIDIGPEGERGSQIFVGTQDPNTLTSSQFYNYYNDNPKYHDIFLRNGVEENYGKIYQYVNIAGVNQWQQVYSIYDAVDAYSIGDFVKSITAGTGIGVSGSGGSAAVVTILNTGVTSLTGTANEIDVSASVGAITVSLPSTVNANINGNAATATALQNARKISLGGDLSGSASFNGTSDITISALIESQTGVTSLTGTANEINVSASTGAITLSLPDTTVGAASYGSASTVGGFTVDEKGRLTGASNINIAIAQSAVTNLTSDLSLKAPLASPALTGTPTSTTAAADTNTTQIATTAYVVGQGYAKLASPTFTGTVTVPTPVNSTDATTKGYVDGKSYTLDSLSDVSTSASVNNNLLVYKKGYENSSWVTQSSNSTNTLRSVVYGNSTWIVGGDSGVLRTSTNYITWTTRNANFGTTRIRTIAYGNGIFIAVGDSAEMRSSTDGITWTTVTSNFGTSIIYDIAYGNSLWIATGYGGAVRRSTNGTTWTTVTSNISNIVLSVAYGNSLWLIGGQYRNIRQSTDGTTWTTVTSNFNSGEAIRAISYGNGIWLAGSDSQFRTSTDGTTWNDRTNPLADAGSFAINRINYSNGYWMLAADYNQVRLSTNGIQWSWTGFGTLPYGGPFGPSSSNYVNGIGFGNNSFIVVGESGNISVLNNTEEWQAKSATDLSLQTILSNVTTNVQTASYTLTLNDAGKVIEMNVGSANNVTIPSNTLAPFSIGTSIDIVQYGSGQTTILADTGVTLRSSESKLKLTGQYSAATLYKRGTNEWMVFGDLST